MSGNENIVDANFRLRRGDFTLDAKFTTEGGLTALFGRSGAGKSTIVDCIAGLIRPDSGYLRIAGETLFDKAAGINLPPERRRVGYVFQDARLFPHMRVRGNLEYGMKLVAAPERRHTVADVVALLGIEKLLDRYPAELSGGEVQRVAIGRALLASPKLLLMDEPLAALDYDRKAEIMPFIERLRDEAGVPIIYVSHAVEEVVRLADTMVVLAEGDTVAFGDVEDIMSRLDLRPHTGRFEAGAVIHVWVAGHDDTYMLTELGFGAGSIWVPRLELDRGTPLRLRLRARDVSLSLERPVGSMTLNVFEGTIVDIENVAEGVSPHVDVLVNAGAPVIARVTRRSVAEHGLRPGMKVYASVKTSSIDRHSLGLGRRR
jgi:molybdate transport system ATP-binding protein